MAVTYLVDWGTPLEGSDDDDDQGGDTKKNKDITSKFFLRNNLVD